MQGVEIMQHKLEQGLMLQGGWAVLRFKSVPDANKAVKMCAPCLLADRAPAQCHACKPTAPSSL